ncbi:MAG: flagellar hook protein FlgE [Acidimicrobiales bacterium]
MLRSMFSGVSGLRSHQTMMDVIGNNIANVNTAGYKSSSVIFQDLLSQLLRGAGGAQDGTGGSNPVQVGLGVKLAAISTNFNQGAAQLTGRSNDLSIAGDGFFIVKSDSETLYTRAGSLSFDTSGQLVAPDGGIVQGWMAQAGVINTNEAIGNLQLPLGTLLPPTRTTVAELFGNLPANATVYAAGPPESGTRIVTSTTVYDGQGLEYPVTYEFLNTGANAWTLNVRDAAAAIIGTSGAGGLTFDAATGVLVGPSNIVVTPPGASWGGGTFDLSTTGLSQFGTQRTVTPLSQNGSTMGSLQSFTIGQDGTLTGVFSNGLTQSIGQIALAGFNNPGGLEKAGNSMFRSTVNSGLAQVGITGSGGRGLLNGGTLEMSNVDLAAEFTNLIVAQRGFQANSRIISASDELLQDLVNLKR